MNDLGIEGIWISQTPFPVSQQWSFVGDVADAMSQSPINLIYEEINFLKSQKGKENLGDYISTFDNVKNSNLSDNLDERAYHETIVHMAIDSLPDKRYYDLGEEYMKKGNLPTEALKQIIAQLKIEYELTDNQKAITMDYLVKGDKPTKALKIALYWVGYDEWDDWVKYDEWVE